jgi:hypothetical protein
VVVIGDGTLVVPGDVAIRRPAPPGPGGPGRDTRPWRQGRLDGRGAACRRRGVALPPPLVVADSGVSDAKRMRRVAVPHGGTLLVAGQRPSLCNLAAGRHAKGRDWQPPRAWPWRARPQVPGVRAVRLRATSPTSGAVLSTIGNEAEAEQYALMGLDPESRAPRLMRAWKRRSWIEPCCRTLQHVLATGACQGHPEEAYDGHWVWRLMGCLGLCSTSRVVCKGRRTREEIIVSLPHSWRFVDAAALALQALSQGVDEKAA